MKQGNIPQYIFFFLLFVLAQLLLFRHVVLLNYAVCFFYIGFILLLPIQMSTIQLMLIAMFTGLVVDTIYDTTGMNAFACVLIAFIRPYVLEALTPPGGYDAGGEISLNGLGIVWYLKYVVLLVVVHHFVYFIFEVWNISLFFQIFLRTISSAIFTIITLLLFEYIFYKPSTK